TLTDERGKMARAVARSESLAAERDRLAERSEGVKRDLQSSLTIAEAAATSAANATATEQNTASAAEQAVDARDERAGLERAALQRSQQAQREQRETAKAEQSAAARVEALQSALAAGEGYGDGVRAAIAANDNGDLPGVGRPIAERLRVAEAHEARLSAVLGPWLGAVCVDDDATLQTVAAWARRREQSVAVLSLSQGTTDLGCDWCTATSPVPTWIAERLSTVSVVSDASRATHTPAVDDEGGVMNMPGALRLGRPDAAVSALSLSRRVDAAKLEHISASAVADAASGLATAADLALEEALANRVTAAKAAEDAQAVAASTRRDAMNARQESERTAARAQFAQREAIAQAKRDEELALALDVLAGERDRATSAVRTVGEALDALETKLGLVRRAAREAADAFAACSSEDARIRERTRSAKETVLRLENQIRESEQRGAKLSDQLKEIEDRRLRVDAQLVEDRRTLGASIQLADQTERKQAEARAAYDQATSARREAEAELHAARQVAHKAEQALREVELRVTRVQTDLEHAETSIVERYGVTLEGAREEAVGLTWTDELRDEASVLSGRLERIGPVNPAAEDEFEEASSRHEYLREQREDLELALADLESAIRKMDRTSRELFEKMFQQVNERFQVIYPRLFRGGNARLELTDPDDMLHTGVEIVCQPPGKRLQSMSLMSGGEKALTAVALIFAIFQLKPTPFCILDEVDAPLDDANVSRFSGLVEEMSATSQFLIITHNKTTMEAARTLYGVTMQEPGVSNVVGVRMHEQETEAPV
ncbi:MAG: chromosome segregation protein, partial [Bradymonadia bacterium]